MINIQRSFSDKSTSSGTLYLVATPIGNLEDMTYRAVRILREADQIAAEDTRQTWKLLNHFGITGTVVSYHEHNKRASGGKLISALKDGKNIALVSDAGMPAISDPGYELVRQAIEDDIAVVPIPGANAALSALIVSGMPTDQFLFVGFLPREKKKKAEQLQLLSGHNATLLFYEAPHRIVQTIESMREAWGGEVRMALARELTKKHEEIIRGTAEACLSRLGDHPPKGEYCIVVEPITGSTADEQDEWWKHVSLEQHVSTYEQEGMTRKEAMKRAAADLGVPKRDVYNELL